MNAKLETSRARDAPGSRSCTLGFGGAAIGNLYRALADEDALGAVHESFAAGVRYFDTAPFYGFGLSEQRLGAALAGAQPSPVYSTKVGRRLVPTGPQDANVGREGYFSPRPFAPVFDYSYDSVMRSHEESLERLGVARVDILLCHDIGRLTHGDGTCGAPARVHGRRLSRHARAARSGRGARHRARRQRVRSLRGASRATASSIASCSRAATPCWNNRRWSHCCRCAPSRRVSIICGGPFNSGILAAGSRAGSSPITTTPHHPRVYSSECGAWKNYAPSSPCRCRRRRCSFRWRIPRSRRVVAGCASAAEARQLRGDVLALHPARILARPA